MSIIRKLNAYMWVPMHERIKFPPRKPDKSTPLYWLARDGGELFFVNETDVCLDAVIVDQGGFATADDAVITVRSDETSFKDVKPHEAIKVAEYDGFYDLDFVLGIDLTIEVEGVRHSFKVPGDKNGPKETVLLWANGDPGKYVSHRYEDKT